MARPRLVTDEQILSTMRAAVLEHGPTVSLELVSDRLGVTSPALLKRFGTRQHLMLEALKPPEEPTWVKEHRDVDDRPLAAQLEDLFTDIWEFAADVVPCVMALRESGIDVEHWQKAAGPGPLRGLAALVHWLGRAKAKGLVAGDDLETAAYTMLGALHLRVLTTHITRQSMATRHHRQALRDLASFFTGALAPRARAPRTPPSRRS